MITPEETGTIIARLAMHSEAFLRSLLREAENAGEALLPDDVAKLESWAMFIRAIRKGITVNSNNDDESEESHGMR